MEEFMTTNMAKASIEAEMNIKFKSKHAYNSINCRTIIFIVIIILFFISKILH